MCGPSHGVVVKTTRRGEQLIAVLVVKADATSFSLIDLLLEMQLSQVGRLELLLAGFSEQYSSKICKVLYILNVDA